MNMELLDQNEPSRSPKSEKHSFSPFKFALMAFCGMLVLWFCIGLAFVVLANIERVPSSLTARMLQLIFPGLLVYTALFALSFSPILCKQLKYSILISMAWIVPPPLFISWMFLKESARLSPSTTNFQVLMTLLILLAVSIGLGTVMYVLGKQMTAERR